MNALLLLACAAIGPITDTEGIGIRHCHADDRALIEVQPAHPSPNRVGGWLTTTNHTLFLRDLTMIPSGTNIMRVRTICGGATSEVSEVQFVIHRVVPAPKVGLVRTFSPALPLPPGCQLCGLSTARGEREKEIRMTNDNEPDKQSVEHEQSTGEMLWTNEKIESWLTSRPPSLNETPEYIYIIQSLRQQLAAAKPAIDFCSGIHIEALTLINQADHPTLNQICEENQSLRKQLAEAHSILRAENARLHACAEGDTREITRLKNEVGDLRAELAKNKAAREVDCDAIAEAIYNALDELPKEGWVHGNDFLPVNVICDHAGQRGLINLMARTIRAAL